MDIIDLAREIGKELQKDDRFIKMNLAKKEADEDKELQEIIGEFNLKRLSVSNEAQKEQPDKDKIEKLNKELKDVYNKMCENVHMQEYSKAQNEVSQIFNAINVILTKSLAGEDPDTIDPTASDCTGDCSGCSGCN